MPSTEFGKAVSRARTHMCPAAACDTYGAKGDVCRSPMHVDKDGRQLGLKLVPIPRRRVLPRAKTKREDAIEHDFVQGYESRGGWVPKWVSPGTPGVTDRIVFSGFHVSRQLVQDLVYRFSGMLMPYAECEEIAKEIVRAAIHFAELKTPKGRLRARQKRVHKRLRDMGYAVEVVRG